MSVEFEAGSLAFYLGRERVPAKRAISCMGSVLCELLTLQPELKANLISISILDQRLTGLIRYQIDYDFDYDLHVLMWFKHMGF